MSGAAKTDDLLARFREGDRWACGRLITLAENRDPGFPDLLAQVWDGVGAAWRTGVTGPPGVGKSTLVNALAGHLADQGRSVGVLAVDPTSPFSGGALLGDRIRMTSAEERRDDVFVRSMATRGSLGGLAQAAPDACDVLDAFGTAEVIVETVGVGQAEWDVAGACDTVVVVLHPHGGDGVQFLKAGILEQADLFVINKADLPGADKAHAELADALSYRAAGSEGAWEPPILLTVATDGTGVAEAASALEAHRAWLERSGAKDTARAAKLEERVRRGVEEEVLHRLWERGSAELHAALSNGSRVPHAVVDELVEKLGEGGPQS